MARDELPTHVIEAARTGDAAAFRRVVERYQAGVFKLALRMTHSHTEAADLTQDAFLRIYRFFEKYDPSKPLAPWLYRVATNVVLNHIRARRSMASLDAQEAEPPAQVASAADATALGETQELVRQAVDRLTPNLRAAVTLYYLKELSLRDMAEALDVPESTAKVWLFRGRKALKDMLEEKLEP